jgi:DNA-binding LytR/AlgR family response regulator
MVGLRKLAYAAQGSYIMNLDSGDARARMRDGGMVPVSRRYRDSLRKTAGSGG